MCLLDNFLRIHNYSYKCFITSTRGRFRHPKDIFFWFPFRITRQIYLTRYHQASKLNVSQYIFLHTTEIKSIIYEFQKYYMLSGRDTGRCLKSGDSRFTRESWQVCCQQIPRDNYMYFAIYSNKTLRRKIYFAIHLLR